GTVAGTNPGNVAAARLGGTDDQAVAVSCPASSLGVNATVTCTGSGTARKGAYQNTGTASATFGPVSVGGKIDTVTITKSDPDHYFGADPNVAIVKQTNGSYKKAAPGPLVLGGRPVTWTYQVTNTGNVPLPSVAVTDDRAGSICTVGPLAPGQATSCTKTASAVRGQYDNTGTATASVDTLTTDGRTRTVTKSATDIDHYFGADPNVAIGKQTNGSDNNAAPVPLVLGGDPVPSPYQAPIPETTLFRCVAVTDDRAGSICTVGPLAPGQATSCTKTASAVRGQYDNTGTATASVDTITTDGQTRTVTRSASDIDHYFGADPRIAIVKQTNGTNNDAAPGPLILVGEPVTWTYAVTNTGNVALAALSVTDDQGVAVSCLASSLGVNATVTCTGSGTARRGSYQNTGTATASVDTVTTDGRTRTVTKSASDIDHYFGADPRLTIVKRTFDTDNDLAPGPIVLVGTAARWSYTVTNAGNVPLANVVVTDDKEGPVCTIPALAAGQTAPACAKTGIVALGQYENVGVASTTFGPVSVGGRIDSVPVAASTVAHSSGGRPGIAIVKRTNGTDNDSAPGPMVLGGKPVTWTYTVTNTGNLPLTAVAVTDDKVGAITCPAATLPPAPDPRATMQCSATGAAIQGRYQNTGTATGASALGPVTARNIDHYFGLDSATLFVVGDMEPHGVGDAVNFWGAQWWMNNQMSGRVTPGVASFKGYARDVNLSTASGCGGAWSTRPGKSPPPPGTNPPVVAVLLTDSAWKERPGVHGPD